MKILSEMDNCIILSSDEVSYILERKGWTNIIDKVCESFIDEDDGKVISPSKTIIPIREHNNDFRTMPSYMERYPNYCGCKIVCVCPDNPKKYDLPSVTGSYILHDSKKQKPLLMCDCNVLTAYRTAAATATAVNTLSKRESKTLGVIGCGQQCYYHIPAIMSVRDIRTIYVTDKSLTPMVKVLEYFNKKGIEINFAEKNVMFEKCDVIVTMTPSTEPIIFLEDINFKKELCLCSIGGDNEDKIEIDPSILPHVDLFCDSYEQVYHTGTLVDAKSSGYSLQNMRSIGEHIGSDISETSKPVKLFLSTGVAIEDLVMGILIYENINLLKNINFN